MDLHVLMLPWLAFGHMIPFFHLSVALAKAGLKVSFVSTPRNIKRLPKAPSDLANLLSLVEIPLPSLEDHEILPEDAEATVDIPGEKVQYLKVVYDLMQHTLKQFVADHRLDWIIIDMIPHWMVDIARENNVPLMHFSIFTASFYSFLFYPECLVGEGQKRLRPSWRSMTSTPEWFDFPSSLAYRKPEAIDIFECLYGANASGSSDAERISKIINGCQAVAMRTCNEFEGGYLELFQKLIGKPVVPVGLLPPREPKREEINADFDGSWDEIFKWLDEQKPESLVFVSFGSEYKPTKDEVYETAHGLESSGLPFLWSLRKPSWAIGDVSPLPSGFTERTSGRGIVCMGWVPQLKLLSHPSIGGSLIQCGCSSIIEGLQFGHRLILLPFLIDQPLNARFLVEKGLGVEVERTEDGSFSRDDIAKALRLAMASEEGKALDGRTKEAARLFGNQKLHEEHYIGKFVDFLKNKDWHT